MTDDSSRRPDDQELRSAVRDAYSGAADAPDAKHSFPVGRAFAASLGYPEELLDRLPASAVDAFAGVCNVSITADIPPGAVVLDLGCGAGLDSLIAAERVGPSGEVVGVDFSQAMVDRATAAAEAAGLDNLRVVQGDAEAVPLEDACIDVVLVNGIFNLNPFRSRLFAELARVLRPGGMLFAAELILRAPLSEEDRSRASWFA